MEGWFWVNEVLIKNLYFDDIYQYLMIFGRGPLCFRSTGRCKDFWRVMRSHGLWWFSIPQADTWEAFICDNHKSFTFVQVRRLVISQSILYSDVPIHFQFSPSNVHALITPLAADTVRLDSIICHSTSWIGLTNFSPVKHG